MALQQFQQVTSANMPHIPIGIFLETIWYIYTSYTVCVQTNQIVLSTVCTLQFMKLCSIQRMDLQWLEVQKQPGNCPRSRNASVVAVANPPEMSVTYSQLNSSVKIVVASNAKLTKRMKNGKELLKGFFFVPWRWVILQHYAEADKVLPFYLPNWELLFTG